MESNGPFLEKRRAEIFQRTDCVLYTHVGYFMSWFSAVELHITMILAMVLRYRQFEDFDLLTKGMDARVKCERLRKACKTRMPIGPKLEERLNKFEEKLVPLRNKLTHSHLVAPEGKRLVYFASLGRTPGAALGMKQVGEPPDHLEMLALFEHSLWLNLFADDLLTVTHNLLSKKILEIDQPRSPVLLAARQRTPRKAPRAKRGRRSRKDRSKPE